MDGHEVTGELVGTEVGEVVGPLDGSVVGLGDGGVVGLVVGAQNKQSLVSGEHIKMSMWKSQDTALFQPTLPVSFVCQLRIFGFHPTRTLSIKTHHPASKCVSTTLETVCQ